jgi:O-antigen ligase
MAEAGDMTLAHRWRITKWLTIAHFPLYGIFSYFRAEDMRTFGYLIYVFPMLFYIGIVFAATLNRGEIRIPGYVTASGNRLHALFTMLFILCMLLGFVFAAIVGTRALNVAAAEFVMLGAMFTFWILIINDAVRRADGVERIATWMFLSLAVYVAMNVVSFLIGFESEGQFARYTREFEAIFSPFGVRINFPFTNSGQYFAIIGGILFIGAVRAVYGDGVIGRLKNMAMGGLGAFVLMAQSARAPIAAVFVVLLYGLVSRKIGRLGNVLVLLALVVVAPSYVYLDVGRIVGEAASLTEVSVSRVDGDVASLSNRIVIWGAVFRHMIESADVFPMLFGYGSYGQGASGLSEEYRWIFEVSYADIEYPTLHNGYVQAFVDFGIFGLAIYVSMLSAALSKLSQCGASRYMARIDTTTPMMILMYLFVCGVTEVTVGYYAMDLLAVFLIVSLCSMALASRNAVCTHDMSLKGGALCH